jgi:hypothetical protein
MLILRHANKAVRRFRYFRDCFARQGQRHLCHSPQDLGVIAPTCARTFIGDRFIHMGCMANTYHRTFRNIGENSRLAQLHVPAPIVLPQSFKGHP